MPDAPLVLYVTAGCPLCDSARAFLRGRGAEFHEIEVKADTDELRVLVRLAGAAVVPTIVRGDDVQVGWDEARVAEMLDDPLPPEEDELGAIFEEIKRDLEREDAEKERTGK